MHPWRLRHAHGMSADQLVAEANFFDGIDRYMLFQNFIRLQSRLPDWMGRQATRSCGGPNV